MRSQEETMNIMDEYAKVVKEARRKNSHNKRAKSTEGGGGLHSATFSLYGRSDDYSSKCFQRVL